MARQDAIYEQLDGEGNVVKRVKLYLNRAGRRAMRRQRARAQRRGGTFYAIPELGSRRKRDE